MRIRKKSWEDKELSTNEHLVHCPEEYKGKWKEYFGNDNPAFAEIGMWQRQIYCAERRRKS